MQITIKVTVLLVLSAKAFEYKKCTEPTQCTNGLKLVHEKGQANTLTLAWKKWPGDEDKKNEPRAAIALLLHVLTEQGFCGATLCEVENNEFLCDAADGNHKRVVIGYESINNTMCPNGILVDVVGDTAVTTLTNPQHLCSEKMRLLNHAPVLFYNLIKYKPTQDILRKIMELEDESLKLDTNVTRSHAAIMAARKWAELNPARFKDIASPAPESKFAVRYALVLYACRQHNGAWKSEQFSMIAKKINNQTHQDMLVFTDLFCYPDIDCLDRGELSRRLQQKANELGSVRLLGVLAAGAGVPEAARVATENKFALAAYDAQPSLAGADYASLLTAGPRVPDIVSALRRVLAACNWRRVALLSEDTPVAAAVAVGLQPNLTLKRVPLPRDNKMLKARLLELKTADARVIVVNAGADGAERVLEAAAALRMTHESGYVWLVREWPPPSLKNSSLLPLLALRTEAREEGQWRGKPPLLNALLTVMLGYAFLIRDYDRLRYDHHTDETLKLLRQNLKNIPTTYIQGHDVKFDEQGVVPPAILLDVFAGGAAPATYSLSGGMACPAAAAQLSDGSARCSLPTGDPFAPSFCFDLALVLGGPALLLAALLGAFAVVAQMRKARRRRDKREQRLRAEACTALLERHVGTAEALANSHVERANLRLLRELGLGRHGRVWLAELTDTAHASGKRYVAAKGPHADCAPVEESELLREAATLARLDHAHVLALCGVCVVGGPPLVLTERAFFGDLQGYLVSRRGLSCEDGEAVHVAAPALTRMAREAALALAYLAECSIVHCDVRAANCLVDERRSLKLADFGMARRFGTGEGAAEDEYRCTRRKLVPVRWMPPESLNRGAFSPASDVWALGVLALELVTLGERPFGALGSAEAVRLVRAGGHARLPAACSRDTRLLALACWRRAAPARPSAAHVAAWLAERPSALAPLPVALLSAADDSDDDSGFGESPPPDIV